jgi:hypothetical protein
MKNLLLSLCFIPTLALAENPQSMSQEQMNQMMGGQGMQQMMMKMQQLESCMKKIDESLLDKLAERGEKLEQSVTKLCKTGKKSQAQKEFVSFANELNNSKELKQMRICVNKIDLPMIKKQMDDKFNIDTSQNICETLSNR